MKRWIRLPVVILLLSGTLGCTEEGASRRGTWPRRPIQISCFASAGGGTDMVDRAIAAAMEPYLGVKINVVNMTGAFGGTALRDVWSREHDGYRWCGVSETILVASVMNGHDTTSKDWTYFMVSGAPGVLSVAGDSKYASLKDVVAAAKSAPGKINAAAAITGGIWHTKLLSLENAAGIKFNRLAYQGSNPSQRAVLSGEAELVVTSISEQAELIKAGKLRPLAMIEPDACEFPGIGSIPSAATAYPALAAVPVRQWLGFALPADTPADILGKVTAAFEKAMHSDAVKKLNESQFLTSYGYSGEKADGLAAEIERAWTWQLQELGIAERSPGDLGIREP